MTFDEFMDRWAADLAETARQLRKAADDLREVRDSMIEMARKQ